MHGTTDQNPAPTTQIDGPPEHGVNRRDRISIRKNPRPRGRASLLLFTLLTMLFAGLLFSPGSAHADQQSRAKEDFNGRIALFPFENNSDAIDVLPQVMPAVKSELKKRGYVLLDEKSLNRFLLKERIRTTAYISKDLARKIRNELKVDAVLMGSVSSFYTKENPGLGLMARLVGTSGDRIIWADCASATGEDFTRILGLGTVKTIGRLVPKVVDRLFSSFSAIPAYKETESTYQVAVMPFLNKSRKQDAGIIVSHMFLTELFKSRKFQPIEYGEVRKWIVDQRVRYKGELDYRSIEGLSKPLTADVFLVGTVELYSDGQDTSSPPEAVITARLIDARKNSILWYESGRLRGDDNITVLDWGRIRSVDSVAQHLVSELVKKMESAGFYHNSN